MTNKKKNIFSPDRLLHPTDNQNANAYPLQIFQNRMRRRKCRVCELFPAKSVLKFCFKKPCRNRPISFLFLFSGTRPLVTSLRVRTHASSVSGAMSGCTTTQRATCCTKTLKFMIMLMSGEKKKGKFFFLFLFLSFLSSSFFLPLQCQPQQDLKAS